MADKDFQAYGYGGRSGYGRSGCGYNCLCDNCCDKRQQQRNDDPRYRAGESHRQEMHRISTTRAR